MAEKRPKKIMLIEPPFWRLFRDDFSLDRYPLALGYLAGTILTRTNWNVLAYNADFSGRPQTRMDNSYLAGRGFERYLQNIRTLSAPIWDEIRSAFQSYLPAVVGISTKSQNFASARMIARIAKEELKDPIVVIGGPHPTMVGQEVLNCGDFDVAVRGEGEETIVELLSAIESGSGLDGIPGIVFRSNGKRIVENRPRELISDLDSICFPHDSAPLVLKDAQEYPKSVGYIFATRGCPQNCFFCGSRNIWGRKTRFRSPDNVVKEIVSLRDRGFRRIHFDDDTFGVKKQYIRDLCHAIRKSCPDLQWGCEIHAGLVDEEISGLIKEAGCTTVEIGVESGNNEILKAIRKNVRIEEVFAAIELLKKQSIMVCAFFMVGFPDETEASLRDTVKAIKRLKDVYIMYHVFTPYPGTEAFTYCKEKGLIDESYDVSLLNHNSPRASFTLNISPARFRFLASRVERMVDRKNRWNRLREVLRLDYRFRARLSEKGVWYHVRRTLRKIVRRNA